MRHLERKYDEATELATYVRNTPELWTEDERKADLAIMARKKLTIFESDNEEQKKLLATKMRASNREKTIGDQMKEIVLPNARLDDPAINDLLLGGEETFRQRVCKRVAAAERDGSIAINRCPTCERIVRTSKAKQCLWCGHDWH